MKKLKKSMVKYLVAPHEALLVADQSETEIPKEAGILDTRYRMLDTRLGHLIQLEGVLCK